MMGNINKIMTVVLIALVLLCVIVPVTRYINKSEKFTKGEMIKLKLDGRVGVVIDTPGAFSHCYWLRFKRLEGESKFNGIYTLMRVSENEMVPVEGK